MKWLPFLRLCESHLASITSSFGSCYTMTGIRSVFVTFTFCCLLRYLLSKQHFPIGRLLRPNSFPYDARPLSQTELFWSQPTEIPKENHLVMLLLTLHLPLSPHLISKQHFPSSIFQSAGFCGQVPFLIMPALCPRRSCSGPSPQRSQKNHLVMNRLVMLLLTFHLPLSPHLIFCSLLIHHRRNPRVMCYCVICFNLPYPHQTISTASIVCLLTLTYVCFLLTFRWPPDSQMYSLI